MPVPAGSVQVRLPLQVSCGLWLTMAPQVRPVPRVSSIVRSAVSGAFEIVAVIV
ncbi:MAG: hypothetical protein BWY91_03082 [bacterium ADurb.BinA028]|nr:MAG: hypothetical protein BWY91_03082 [bacterium ADurb.BinA028]